MSDDDKPPKTDTKPAMPAQPPTTKIEALTDRKLLEMLVGSVKDTNNKIDQVSDKVDTLSLNVEILQDDGRDTKARIIRLEGWKEGVDNRLNSNSQRARGASAVDNEHAAAIASIKTDVADLKADVGELRKSQETQTGMLLDLTAKASKLLEKPLVRSILTMAGTAILTWLAAHGGVK